MLDMMFGFSTTVAEADSICPVSMAYVATYVNDNGEKVASCLCTLPTAAALGCAFAMIQPNSTKHMLNEKCLDAAVVENLYEVMNIFSSLLMDDKSSHLKLSEVNAANGSLIQAADWSSCSFSLQLGQYGQGQLLFNISPSDPT